MKNLIILFVVSLSVSACNIEALKTGAGVLESIYCSDLTADGRTFVLNELRKEFPHYPSHGYCGIKIDL